MKILHGADEPTGDFQSVLLEAVRGAPRWPTPDRNRAALLAAEQQHVDRFTHLLWVQAWAAGAAWTSARMSQRIVIDDPELAQFVRDTIRDRPQMARGDGLQP